MWRPLVVRLLTTLSLFVAGCGSGRTDGDDIAHADAEQSRARNNEPPTLVTGQPCDTVASAGREIIEQETAIIPLVTGLTLGYIWVGPDSGKNDFDHECLTQVTAVEASRVVYMSRCANPRDSLQVQRRTQLCRADLRDGSIYRTEFGAAIPDLVAGSTMSILSRRAFRELRDRGETQLRQVHLRASSWQVGAAAADQTPTSTSLKVSRAHCDEPARARQRCSSTIPCRRCQ